LRASPPSHRGSGIGAVGVDPPSEAADQLDRLRAASCLIINTSPGNHQACIAVSGVDKSDSKDL